MSEHVLEAHVIQPAVRGDQRPEEFARRDVPLLTEAQNAANTALISSTVLGGAVMIWSMVEVSFVTSWR